MSGPVHNGEDGRLRLQAAGQDDLEVLSALLQDAIIPGEDMFHDQGGRRFVMVVNRFCWDQPPVRGVTSEDGGPVYQRRLCGVQIRGVRAVRQSGMPSDRKSALFNLLAIRRMMPAPQMASGSNCCFPAARRCNSISTACR